MDNYQVYPSTLRSQPPTRQFYSANHAEHHAQGGRYDLPKVSRFFFISQKSLDRIRQNQISIELGLFLTAQFACFFGEMPFLKPNFTRFFAIFFRPLTRTQPILLPGEEEKKRNNSLPNPAIKRNNLTIPDSGEILFLDS